MRFSAHNFPTSRVKARCGYTLVEMMVTVVVFLGFLMAALVSTQIYGLRTYTLAATKIAATTDAREALNEIRYNVRCSTSVSVGMYSAGTFSPIPLGSNQIGNAIQLVMPQYTNPITYYQDSTTTPTNLWKIDQNGSLIPVLNYMTNYYCFSEEDCYGTNISFFIKSPVISVTWNFVQWEYPIAIVTNNVGIDAYDYYRIKTRISRRQ